MVHQYVLAAKLVDENALLDALRARRLAGAALDVLCDEDSNGMPDHSLVAYFRTYDNLIITPHSGGCTAESMEKTECFLADRLLTLLKHEAAILIDIFMAGANSSTGILDALPLSLCNRSRKEIR